MIAEGCKQCNHMKIVGSVRGGNGEYMHLYQCQKGRYSEGICEDYEEKRVKNNENHS